MASLPLAVQLFTVRDQVAQDYAGTLREIADIGYTAVEPASLGAYSAQELRAVLDSFNLTAASMHVSPDRLLNDLDAVIDELKTLGITYAVWPWLPPDQRSLADYEALAPKLEVIGQKCKDAGLQLCYHNHDFEFAQQDGRNGFDVLADGTTPDLVQFELDVYWVSKAGLSPAALLHSLSGRVPLVHLKDMTNDDEEAFAEVGSGKLDIPGIIAAANDAGVQGFVVEQDVTKRPPLESIAISIDYLRSIGVA